MYGAIWCTWWLGDGVGAIVVTPLVLLWRENLSLQWSRNQFIELALLFSGLFFTACFVFGGSLHSVVKDYPLEYLCIPFGLFRDRHRTRRCCCYRGLRALSA